MQTSQALHITKQVASTDQPQSILCIEHGATFLQT